MQLIWLFCSIFSERADPNWSLNYKGRLKEGSNINKSLVTLGNVIKTLGMIKLHVNMYCMSLENVIKILSNPYDGALNLQKCIVNYLILCSNRVC